MMHLLRLTFRFQLSSGKTILSAAFCVNLESAMRIPKTQSAFHQAQRNGFRRGGRPQFRLFGGHDPKLLSSSSAFTFCWFVINFATCFFELLNRLVLFLELIKTINRWPVMVVWKKLLSPQ